MDEVALVQAAQDTSDDEIARAQEAAGDEPDGPLEDAEEPPRRGAGARAGAASRSRSPSPSPSPSREPEPVVEEPEPEPGPRSRSPRSPSPSPPRAEPEPAEEPPAAAAAAPVRPLGVGPAARLGARRAPGARATTPSPEAEIR